MMRGMAPKILKKRHYTQDDGKTPKVNDSLLKLSKNWGISQAEFSVIKDMVSRRGKLESSEGSSK